MTFDVAFMRNVLHLNLRIELASSKPVRRGFFARSSHAVPPLRTSASLTTHADPMSTLEVRAEGTVDRVAMRLRRVGCFAASVEAQKTPTCQSQIMRSAPCFFGGVVARCDSALCVLVAAPAADAGEEASSIGDASSDASAE